MADHEFQEVDPVLLHLPPTREDGADFLKLAQQFSQFGKSTETMPAIWVSRGIDGRLMINNGVTRATRIARYSPGTLVTVEVIDELPAPVGHLPTIGDRL